MSTGHDPGHRGPVSGTTYSAQMIGNGKNRWWLKVLTTSAQVSSGLVVGYFGTFAVMVAVLFAARTVGVRPTIGDLTAMAGVALWTLITLAGAVTTHHYRRPWLPLAASLALSTAVAAVFAIVVVVPFGTGMRDFG